MLHDSPIRRFTKELEFEGQIIKVRFDPVNIKVKQLYQVYIADGNKEIRIHIQKGPKGFYITDPERLPEKFESLKDKMVEAVEEA